MNPSVSPPPPKPPRAPPAARGVLPSARAVPADGWPLIAARMLTNFSSGFLTVMLTIYLVIAGMSPLTIGFVVSTQGLVGGLLSIPIAMLADNFGRKRFIVLGLLMSGLAGLVFLLTLDPVLVFAGAAMMGLSTANANAPFVAMLTGQTTSEDNRNQTFAMLSFLAGIAYASGSLAAAAPTAVFAPYFGLGAVDSFRPLFAVQFFLGLAAALLVHLRVRDVRGPRPAGRRSWRSLVKVPRKSMPVIVRLSILGLIGLGAGVILPLFSLWFYLRFHLDVAVIAPYFSAMSFLTAFASLLSPRLARQHGSVVAIVGTQISSVALLVSIPFMPTYVLAGLLMIARNVMMNMAGPIQTSFTMGLVAPDERATASSIINTFDAVPRAFGPSMGGYFFTLGLLSLPFFVTGVMYASSIASFYFLFRNLRPPAADPPEAPSKRLDGGR